MVPQLPYISLFDGCIQGFVYIAMHEAFFPVTSVLWSELDANSACRLGFLASSTGGNSEEISRVVYNCKTYEDPKVDLEYKEAERYCQRNGGQVAKITRDLLSTQVETVLPDNLWIYKCLYNGLKYDKPRGVWRWADGNEINTKLCQ